MPAPNNSGAVVQAQPQKKVDILKGILNAPSVMEQFRNALSKNASTFVASVIDLYNTDSNLQLCEPKAVVMEALKAAVLHLPINKALGYAYIIPFNNTKKIKDEKTGAERYVKVMEPTFQLGYKGYIQLAMRTGQYRTLNADVVYEGEVRKVSKLTGEIAFDGEKVSDKVVGYFCYFELLNGFSKTLYSTVEQMAKHAKRYSKGLKKDTTVEQLLALAALPVQDDSKTVGWLGNFHAMGVKTVLRNLLSKYGYLSIEMQQAFDDDMRGEDYSDKSDKQDDGVTKTIVLDPSNAQTVRDGQAALPASDPTNQNDGGIPDPGY
ncbi:MAG: recombinase RecT [Bacteroidaceae bacterium]|nr:recombinase RecT [Bacteroidaceae bacterium]